MQSRNVYESEVRRINSNGLVLPPSFNAYRGLMCLAGAARVLDGGQRPASHFLRMAHEGRPCAAINDASGPPRGTRGTS